MNIRRLMKSTPFIGGMFHGSAPYHTGRTWENVAGLQLVRIAASSMALGLRRAPAAEGVWSEAREALDRDGVVMLPRFLPDDQWALVRREYETYRQTCAFKPYKPGAHPSMRVATQALTEHPESFPHTLRCFGQHDTIVNLGSAIVRRDLRATVLPMSYLILSKDDQADYDDDVENILHADVHYPTAKAFFYLEPTNEKNGAYIYAKGSHRLSVSRLKFEYDLSVRQARLKNGDHRLAGGVLEKRGEVYRNIIAEDQKRAMDLEETQFNCDANTLIVSNNRGFHRRGAFEINQTRAVLVINFRHFGASRLRRLLNRG